MSFRQEVVPFLVASIVMGLAVWGACELCGVRRVRGVVSGAAVAFILCMYMLYFFRDPERQPPSGEDLVVAGADGTVAKIAEVVEEKYLKTECTRISIFLSLFDVHVNRAPISGKSKFLGYYPGKRLFTFQEKSSEVNQHNKILITGSKTSCLVTQIVGPVCRRVVYWPDHDAEVEVKMGDPIGMMKFGSRMDMYFPKGDIELLVKEGDKVAAGETVIARVKGGAAQ